MQTFGNLQPTAAGLSLIDAEAYPPLQVAGVSTAWSRLLRQAAMMAPHLQAAAIEGEHGTGKYTLARYLHSRSPLADLPLRRCDAREWLATECDAAMIKGILYLDRVDLLAGIEQSLLAGVLRDMHSHGRRTVVIASTDLPLLQLAAQGEILPDLAYRLTAVRFAVPPLRQRREDIAPIAQSLLARLCARYGLRPAILGPGALERLLIHTWPGNIHELASVLESALLEAQHGVISAASLALPAETETQSQTPLAGKPVDLSLDGVIHRHVEYVVHLNNGNKLRAARQLAISRSTLYRILAHAPLEAGLRDES